MGIYGKRELGYELSFTDSETRTSLVTDRVSPQRYREFIDAVTNMINSRTTPNGPTPPIVTAFSFLYVKDSVIHGYGEDNLKVRVHEEDHTKLKFFGNHRYDGFAGNLVTTVIEVSIDDVLGDDKPEAPKQLSCLITPANYGALFMSNEAAINISNFSGDDLRYFIKHAESLIADADPEGLVVYDKPYMIMLGDSRVAAMCSELRMCYCDADHVWMVGYYLSNHKTKTEVKIKVAVNEIKPSASNPYAKDYPAR